LLTAGVYRSVARITHNGTDPPLDIAVELIVPEPLLAGACVLIVLATRRRAGRHARAAGYHPTSP